MKRVPLALVIVAGLILVVAGGCGGSGSSSGGGANSLLNVFLTDDLSTNYSHVWVKIHKVELDFTGGSTTLFESADGLVVDLRALGDGGLFKALGATSVTAGGYSGFKVTLAKSLSIVQTGDTIAQEVEFSDSLDFGVGQSRIVGSFIPPFIATVGTANLVLDFDLSAWTLVAGKVTPLVVKGDDSGLSDDDNHVEDEFRGTISGLTGTAPNQRFDLVFGGAKVAVVTDATTGLYLESGSSNPELANGQAVEVDGQFSAAENAVLAQSIRIEDEDGEEDPHSVKGQVLSSDEGGGTIVVSADAVEDFVPAQTSVTIELTESTIFLNNSGTAVTKAQFFELLALAGDGVQVKGEGTYDSGTNKLTATKVKIDNPEDEFEVEARGAVATADSVAGTIDVTLIEWYGFSAEPGDALEIRVVDGLDGTEYEGANGEELTREAFFAAISAGSTVKAHGEIDAGILVATELRLIDGDGGAEDDPMEALGTVTAENSGEGTLAISILSWFGFESSIGAAINVTTDGATEFRNAAGETVTKNQFFDALEIGDVVDVDGEVVGDTFAATKVQIED